jgi:hypothetical protein
MKGTNKNNSNQKKKKNQRDKKNTRERRGWMHRHQQMQRVESGDGMQHFEHFLHDTSSPCKACSTDPNQTNKLDCHTIQSKNYLHPDAQTVTISTTINEKGESSLVKEKRNETTKKKRERYLHSTQTFLNEFLLGEVVDSHMPLCGDDKDRLGRMKCSALKPGSSTMLFAAEWILRLLFGEMMNNNN